MDGLKIGAEEFARLETEVADDLTAFFMALQDDVMRLIEKASRERWSPDRLIREVDALLAPEPRGAEDDHGSTR